MTDLEKALGGRLERDDERIVPHSNDEESFTIYFSLPSGKTFESVFRKITNYTNPPFAKFGGVVEAGCTIETPTGMVFHALEIIGDLKGMHKDIGIGAAAEGVLLATVEGDQLITNKGQNFALNECSVVFT